MASNFLSHKQGLQYFVLDVFTDTRLTGNALAVVLHDGSLGTEMMQKIARETNLSETTFVERRDVEVERVEGVRVRIFTTNEELRFAGHPTLGTASLLRAIAPECLVDDTIALALNVGRIEVRFEPQAGAGVWPMRGEMTQRDAGFGAELDAAEVASLIGLGVEDLDPRVPVQIVSTGTRFPIVVLRSAEALARLRVRQEEAAEYLRMRGARWFYVLGPEAAQEALAGSMPTWRARMQFNGGEDPATGSAAGCAISHLVNRGAIASGQRVRLLQGIEMQRPSEIYVSAKKMDHVSGAADEVTEVRVGGSTILVASGRLFLP